MIVMQNLCRPAETVNDIDSGELQKNLQLSSI